MSEFAYEMLLKINESMRHWNKRFAYLVDINMRADVQAPIEYSTSAQSDSHGHVGCCNSVNYW